MIDVRPNNMPVVIRLAEPADARQMLAIFAPLVLDTAIWFALEPPTEDEFRQRISARLERAPWLICESEGTVLGYAYGGMYRTRRAYQWTSEVAINVHEAYHRRGIGRGLYVSLFECLRVLGYVNAVAVITLPNPASEALHESLGFEPVGLFRSIGYKLGRWHDRGWWQLSLQRPNSSPGLLGGGKINGYSRVGGGCQKGHRLREGLTITRSIDADSLAVPFPLHARDPGSRLS